LVLENKISLGEEILKCADNIDSKYKMDVLDENILKK